MSPVPGQPTLTSLIGPIEYLMLVDGPPAGRTDTEAPARGAEPADARERTTATAAPVATMAPNLLRRAALII